MNNTDQLQHLRDQILTDIVPLVLQSESGQDRFDILLRIIQLGNTSTDVFQRAYESALKIESPEDKLDALMSLMDEIDYQIPNKDNNDESSSDVQSPAGENQPTQQAS